MDLIFLIDKLTIIFGIPLIGVLMFLIYRSINANRHYRTGSLGVLLLVVILFIISRGTYSPRNDLPNATFTNEDTTEREIIRDFKEDKHQRLEHRIRQREKEIYKEVVQ